MLWLSRLLNGVYKYLNTITVLQYVTFLSPHRGTFDLMEQLLSGVKQSPTKQLYVLPSLITGT